MSNEYSLHGLKYPRRSVRIDATVRCSLCTQCIDEETARMKGWKQTRNRRWLCVHCRNGRKRVG